MNAGATLDLDGNSQTVGNFSSTGTLPGTGGTVTNSSTTTLTFTVDQTTGQDWAGQITSADASHQLNFVKTGNTQLTFRDNNSYFGTTTVQGNILALVDQGRLSNTTAISVTNSVLKWDDSGIQGMDSNSATPRASAPCRSPSTGARSAMSAAAAPMASFRWAT
ncbi:MAG: hypothetical protein WDN28_29205 [Chthoniobacter sp.]